MPYAPASAPAELAEVDGAVLFVIGVGACIRPFKGEPGIGLVAGRAAPALDDLAAHIERRRLQLPLAGPAAGEPVGAIVAILQIGKTPGGAGRVFENDVFLGLVLDGGPALEDALPAVDAIEEVHDERLLDVAHGDLKRLAVGVVGLVLVDVLEDDIAVAPGEGGLQVGFSVKAGAPRGVFLGRRRAREIERCALRQAMRGMDVLCAIDARAPVERLQPVVLVDAHGVCEIAGLNDPEFCVGTVFDGLRVSGRQREECGGEREGGGNGAKGHGRYSCG